MKIAVCDDDRIFADKLTEDIREILKQHDKKWDTQTFYNGADLLAKSSTDKIDAVYLDIDMPEIDGYEIAGKLSENNQSIIIIFVSSKSDMIFSSYKYHPFWFIRKSHMSELEYATCDMIRKWTVTNMKDKCVVKLENGSDFEVNLNDTLYFLSHDHYFQIKSVDGELSTNYRGKLTLLEQSLSEFWFVRVHSKYLVNIRFISTIDTKSCVLKSGDRIPIGRSKYGNVVSVFQNYKRSIR